MDFKEPFDQGSTEVFFNILMWEYLKKIYLHKLYTCFYHTFLV